MDGRLVRQACRLVTSPLPSVLILEGTGADLKNSGMRREAIQGAIININLILGIPILRASHTKESAKLMVYAAKQVGSLINASTPRHGRRPRSKRKAQLYILQGLPGIGPDRAQQLLDKFGSIEAVLTANHR